jgi:hypothetical protein
MTNKIEVMPTEMHSQVESWNLPTDNEINLYTVNHVIHAYTTGLTEGLEKDEKLFLRQIKDNSTNAAKDTFQVIEYLKSIGISPISAHLRIESRYSVDVLITVSDLDFANESFSNVYPFANSLQEKSKTDLYSVTFIFINRSSAFDQEMVKSDGFIYSFKALEKK